jgi:hypothetical protein
MFQKIFDSILDITDKGTEINFGAAVNKGIMANRGCSIAWLCGGRSPGL